MAGSDRNGPRTYSKRRPVNTICRVLPLPQLSTSKTAFSTESAADALALATLPRERVDAIYVHVPFCAHKCHYCDFYSITRQTGERMSRFVDLILAEAEIWQKAGVDLQPATAFFGGGTPTALPLAEMDRLLAGLRDRVDFSNIVEWTIEANPATLDLDYCQMLIDNGVDRISFGAQSFDRQELKILERHHEPDDVPRSIEIARTAGFQRINADLIYGIPGQTARAWLDSLEQAIALGLTHLSCYGLTYEPNTALAVRKRLGQFTAVSEPVEIGMFFQTRERLATAGLLPYEISNFSTAGEACRHNLHYWNGGNYASLGPSAASHVGGTRFRNRPHLGEWESSIATNTLPAIDVEQLSSRQRAGELIMLQLRLPGGVRFDEIEKRFAFDPRQQYALELSQLRSQNLIEVDAVGFRLGDAGLIVADAIAGQFVAVD